MCESCPLNTTTSSEGLFGARAVYATSPWDCVCQAGFEPTGPGCRACAAGSFKPLIGNESCTQCPVGSGTVSPGAQSEEECICEPGWGWGGATCEPCPAGTAKDAYGDEPCLLCSGGTFCPPNAVAPTPCPALSWSLDGSATAGDCFCVPGAFFDVSGCELCHPGSFSDTNNASECVLCPADTFNPAQGSETAGDCLSCTNASASPPGSISSDACTCNLGYIPADGGACQSCAPGTYRENATEYKCSACPTGTYNGLHASDSAADCAACPPNRTSEPASGDLAACVCVAGFYTDGAQCALCPPGRYSVLPNASSCDACPPGTSSQETGAVSPAVCGLCDDGSFALHAGASSCERCPQSTYQNATLGPGVKALNCTPCPSNSGHNLYGQVSEEVCLCLPGFHSDLFPCERCPVGTACAGNNSAEACAWNFYAPEGSVQCTACPGLSYGGGGDIDSCLCPAGSEGTHGLNCSLCAAGKFQATNDSQTPCQACPPDTFAPAAGATSCLSCTGNSSAPAGSRTALSCTCDPGFVGDGVEGCRVCDANFYCPGGSVSNPCPPHSESAPGASAPEECLCVPGYYLGETGCAVCPLDFFCVGGGGRQKCPDNSTAPPRSTGPTACACDDKTWRGCVVGEDGVGVNQDGNCTIDYALPCFPCSADMVCVNNTVKHCPAHSESPPGSAHADDCVCVPGFYSVAGGHDEAR